MTPSKLLFRLVTAFFVFKIVIAGLIPLGNNEVYYWTYALFPDWSHFDQPPMVGWMIQFFTFDLSVSGEAFLRLGSILCGLISTLLVYKIGKLVKDDLTGWIAAAMYNASIYAGIVAGFLVMPDAPLSLFWLMSLYYLMQAFSNDSHSKTGMKYILYFGVSAGLAMVSKYHGIYLWIGAFGYILLYDRSWLKSGAFYLSLIASMFIFSPVVIWNLDNELVSFGFQGGRLNVFGNGIHFKNLLAELLGQFLYQNPVIYVLIVGSVLAFIRRVPFISTSHGRLLLSLSLPLILSVLIISLFSQSLPHWTGPGFASLIIMAAVYVRSRITDQTYTLYPRSVIWATVLIVVIFLSGIFVVNFYPGVFSSEKTGEHLGQGDLTLDSYGWSQVEKQFLAGLEERGQTKSDIVLISNKRFPGAHIDYYIARPNGIKLLLLGKVSDIHKYRWINEIRGMLKEGESAYMLVPSNYLVDPEELYKGQFGEIRAIDEFEIERGGVLVKKVSLYELTGFQLIN